ncbi:aminotransferase class IV [Nonomuraea jiangxiensis]|uniref:Branched-chain amino acid aminotransferase/4-amino-4-deoxychorismate lyase n=1 Tax=Nonomuraea jiangxiensis TaxID=633440 RepID=A0A1G9BWX9_9ACTN|nr:aminotransferase class IV [Nonomuraea jiangxiensis]SDK43978.1 Branched-chain amino acid aminotransferase/4-amino-4-deoxychorismate lyase [Nonomuraea jiangxiensis]
MLTAPPTVLPAERAYERLAWTGPGLIAAPDRWPGDPAVVDSWLVAEGRVRDLALHGQRFLRACAEAVPELPAAEIRRFLGAVRHWLPPRGRWFPRIEAYGGAEPRLALWPRPAPEPGPAEVTLWIPPESDPRRRPEVKGPDLPVLARLRERARAVGADDALLHDGDGTVLETAHSALVWWRGDTLCAPDDGLPVLPSITRSHLERLAGCWRCPVRRERVSLAELPELETWTLNALHGLRPVRAWADADGRSTPAKVSVRAAEWRQAVRHRAVLPALHLWEQPCAR